MGKSQHSLSYFLPKNAYLMTRRSELLSSDSHPTRAPLEPKIPVFFDVPLSADGLVLFEKMMASISISLDQIDLSGSKEHSALIFSNDPTVSGSPNALVHPNRLLFEPRFKRETWEKLKAFSIQFSKPKRSTL
jgi:hypothetical protein